MLWCNRIVVSNLSVLTYTMTLLIDISTSAVPYVTCKCEYMTDTSLFSRLDASYCFQSCWLLKFPNSTRTPFYAFCRKSGKRASRVTDGVFFPLNLTLRILTEIVRMIPNFNPCWSVIKSLLHVRISLSMSLVNRFKYLVEYSAPGFPLNVLIHSEA